MKEVKMSFKELMKFMQGIGLEDELPDCFSDKTGFKEYDELLNNDGAGIHYMSPTQYFLECMKVQGYKKSLKEYADETVNPELVEKHYKSMVEGGKFPLPFIDHVKGHQEGRHRVLAAEKMGVDSVPVVIIR